MNKLEKFFNTLHTSQSGLLKKYTTEEIVTQIKEYVDYSLFICKNVYRMLISHKMEDRINGAAILKAIMFQFKLKTDFKIEYKTNKEEYLLSTGEEFIGRNMSIKEQSKLIKRMADLEHVDVKIVNKIDFKGDSNVQIKKQKLKDKPIENLMDFFDNLTANLLNYEWNKRHGAFLAFTAMFSESWSGEIEIKVDSSLFNKIYEILKNDKFNDFVEDKTTAPVREAAACLLASIYPRIPPNTIINELFNFLKEEDWQTQYSALLALDALKQFIVCKEKLCKQLESLLKDSDEDVKLLSADILCYFAEYCDRKSVSKICWENIRDEEELAVSKTSIISLLSKIYSLDNNVVGIQKNIELLFPCFNSPIVEVRKNAIEIVKEIENESVNFLLAEMILLDEKDEIRGSAVKVLKAKKSLGDNFLNLFIKIISGSLLEPYSSDDFVSYDELFFTKSGVKLIGEETILKNRICLFETFPFINSNFNTNTTIGKTFQRLFCLFGSINTEENCIKRCKSEMNLDEIYKNCVDLHQIPFKEMKIKVENPLLPSLHLLGTPLYRYYLRLKTVLDFPNLETEIFNLFQFETCKEFLQLISKLIVKFYEETSLDISNFIVKAFNCLKEEENGFLIFFEVFGIRLLEKHFVNQIEKELDFFSKTINFYFSKFEELENLFILAYEKKNFPILKGFLKNLKYSERFVKFILEDFNVNLLENTITNVDYSFFPLFVKPLLKEMALSCTEASKVFSFIVPRLSFQMNCKISNDLKIKIEEAKESLEALLDINKIPEYKCKCPTSIVLRGYQAEGVKWINFLYSFNLNGILADDMGLGKTIQVLYFVCSEIYQTNKKVLVLCPSSITGHWESEVKKYFPFIKSSIHKKNKIHNSSIVIVSYDMFRNDYAYFIEQDWFYIVLDEGHVLRNSQTILYSRICQLRPTHKLVLTGTPVHNSVDDLVSIFNFIMPNYLEKENIFAYNSKMGDNELEKLHNKLSELNKKILPFILRRLKIDVLTDLPPKIIRDIAIEMGPIQKEVYDSLGENLEEGVSYGYKSDGLKRTRDLLHASSHTRYFKKDIKETPCKVKALWDIISLCGGEEMGNKVLIFFQFKSTIDFVIEETKSKFNLQCLRLDGTVPSNKRSKIAQDFNEGSVPLLFLTTQVGGLGLNLTGADTVIFFEHDWNPFNDLQAMDRAHRIGQKKTVNVFRLITKGTLEEKVMDLQSFKLFIASSLVTQQNADIETMDTKDLLERFSKQ